MNKNIAIAVLGILVILLGYLCINRTKEYVVSPPKYDTIYVTKDSIVKVKVPKPYRVDSIRVDTIVIPPDSLIVVEYKKLYKQLNERKYYNDTLYRDSLNTISLYEECFNNEILNRKLGVSLKSREITKTYYVDKTPKWEAGIGLIANEDLFAPSIALTNKSFVYLAGYDLRHDKIMLGIFYKFKLK